MKGLLTIPDPRLRRKCLKVKAITPKIRALAEYIRGQLVPMKALGLAAPQLGELIRIIAVRVSTFTIQVIINPEVIKNSGHQLKDEGCLSIPGQLFRVDRPMLTAVKGLDPEGNEVVEVGYGMLAAVLAHEIDHLDGIMIDKIGERLDPVLPTITLSGDVFEIHDVELDADGNPMPE